MTPIVKIKWYSEIEGGRKKLPVGPHYASITKIDGVTRSVMFVFLGSVEEAQVHFLVKGLEPYMVPDFEFNILEGFKVVARAKVVGDVHSPKVPKFDQFPC